MIARILTLFVVFAVSSTLYGQTASIVEREGGIVEIASSIRHVVFVYHQSTIADSQSKVTELEKLEHPAVAVRKAKPSAAVSGLIDSLYDGHRMDYSLHSASAIDYGDDGYFWKIEWLVSPSQGGSSGPPTQHYSIVRGDGTVVRPSVFLCDTFGSSYDEDNDQIFSVLALDNLETAPTNVPSDQDLKSAANKALAEAVESNKLECKFQFDSIEEYEFSGKLNSVKDVDGELVVWAVRFVDAAKPKSVDPDSPSCLTIWVAGNLTTSRITVGEWDPNTRR